MAYYNNEKPCFFLFLAWSWHFRTYRNVCFLFLAVGMSVDYDEGWKFLSSQNIAYRHYYACVPLFVDTWHNIVLLLLASKVISTSKQRRVHFKSRVVILATTHYTSTPELRSGVFDTLLYPGAELEWRLWTSDDEKFRSCSELSVENPTPCQLLSLISTVVRRF